MKKLIRNQLKEIHGGKGICRPSAGFNCENGFTCCARFQGYSGLCYAIGDEPAECWLPQLAFWIEIFEKPILNQAFHFYWV